MKAYQDYFEGKIKKHELTEEEIKNSIKKLNIFHEIEIELRFSYQEVSENFDIFWKQVFLFAHNIQR